MAMASNSPSDARTYPNPDEVDVVVEEIEGDDNISMLTHSGSPVQLSLLDNSQSSASKPRREFGNISPISEVLDNDDDDDGIDVIEVPSSEEDKCEGSEENCSAASGKITPEPGVYPTARASFPRISDGRSSPILAFSPSLIKSPSSNGSGKLRNNIGLTSPTSGGGSGKRTRNIARILDNISDHSSGEDEVNNVNMMMSKFSV